MPQPPALVLFDMDDVLFLFSRSERLANLATLTGLSEPFIHETVWGSGFDEACDRGQYTAEEIPRLLGERLGVPITGEDFMDARLKAMQPDDAVWRLVERIRPRTGLAMLTDNGPLLRTALPRAFPQLAETFGERLFFSCEFKSSKTEPDIFPMVLDRLGHRAEETLFVDNSAEFIESARSAGLRTHLFRGAEDLEDALAGEGLLQLQGNGVQ